MATIYIHWPFCISKCAYCDFNSFPFVKEGLNYELWFDSYKRVLSEFDNSERISSIYFGGGTPSLMPTSLVWDLLDFINRRFRIPERAEITMEANPGAISIEKARKFREYGINRLSIGLQSIYEEGLKVLGRNSHTASEGVLCIQEMSEVFDNISIDLIYNRPLQIVSNWKRELVETVGKLEKYIKHISCYELIIEKGTKLQKQISEGILPKPQESDEFFDITHDILTKNGLKMYEVSNYAKLGYEGRHNISYWNYENYYGIGPGAHSRISENFKKVAIEQEKNPKLWLEWAQNPKFDREILTDMDVLKEKIIMGLRAKNGVKFEDLSSISDIDKKLSTLSENLYIICDKGRVIMTYEGLKKLNLVIQYILGE